MRSRTSLRRYKYGGEDKGFEKVQANPQGAQGYTPYGESTGGVLQNIKAAVPKEKSAVKPTVSKPTTIKKTKQVLAQEKYIKDSVQTDNNYVIIDKKNNNIHYYDKEHNFITSEPIITGASNKDTDYAISMADYFKQTGSDSHEEYFNYLLNQGTKTTPSGHFTVAAHRKGVMNDPSVVGSNINAFRPEVAAKIRSDRVRDYGKRGELYTLKSDEGVYSSKAIHGTENPERVAALADPNSVRDLSNGCVNVNGQTICFDQLQVGTGIYSLPEETEDIVRPQAKVSKYNPTQINKFRNTVYNSLKKKGVEPTKEAVDFITTVGGKESLFGSSTKAKLEDYFPVGSKGTFQINPESFVDYLPEDYDVDFDKQVEAVHNFYNANYKKAKNAQDLYAKYNTGKMGKSSPQIRTFGKLYNQVKANYKYGGRTPVKKYGGGTGSWGTDSTGSSTPSIMNSSSLAGAVPQVMGSLLSLMDKPQMASSQPLVNPMTMQAMYSPYAFGGTIQDLSEDELAQIQQIAEQNGVPIEDVFDYINTKMYESQTQAMPETYSQGEPDDFMGIPQDEAASVPQFAKGGWIKKAAASIKRRGTAGKCTPMTKPGCTGRARALAKTFKKIARNRKHAMGGIVDSYNEYALGGYFQNGGETEPVKLSSQNRQDWNNYVKFLRTQGLAGNTKLDTGGYGNQVLQEYIKTNPDTSLTPELIPAIQQDFTEYRNFALNKVRQGKAALPTGATEADFMKSLSKTDAWPGSETTKHMFPSAYMIYADSVANRGFATTEGVQPSGKRVQTTGQPIKHAMGGRTSRTLQGAVGYRGMLPVIGKEAYENVYGKIPVSSVAQPVAASTVPKTTQKTSKAKPGTTTTKKVTPTGSGNNSVQEEGLQYFPLHPYSNPRSTVTAEATPSPAANTTPKPKSKPKPKFPTYGPDTDWNTLGRMDKVEILASLNYMSPQMLANSKWDDLHQDIKNELKSYFKNQAPIMEDYLPIKKAYGGSTSNAEVEGGEIIQAPGSKAKKIYGRKHEDGGVMINAPEGTKVFSDRLKVDGKSMAKRKLARDSAIAKLEKKLNADPTNAIYRSTIERMGETLAMEEEQDMALQEFANELYAPPQMEEEGDMSDIPQSAYGGYSGNRKYRTGGRTGEVPPWYSLGAIDPYGYQYGRGTAMTPEDARPWRTEGEDFSIASTKNLPQATSPAYGSTYDNAPQSALGAIDPYGQYTDRGTMITGNNPLTPAEQRLATYDIKNSSVYRGLQPAENPGYGVVGQGYALPSGAGNNEEDDDGVDFKLGAGDYIGMASSVLGPALGLMNTEAARRATKPRVNRYAGVGQREIDSLRDSQDYAYDDYAEDVRNVKSKYNTLGYQNRVGASGLGTLRTLGSALASDETDAMLKARGVYGNRMTDLKAREGVATTRQDMAQAQGQTAIDEATAADIDAYFSSRGENFQDMATGLGTIGAGFNKARENQFNQNLIGQLSQYGLALNDRGQLVDIKSKSKTTG